MTRGDFSHTTTGTHSNLELSEIAELSENGYPAYDNMGPPVANDVPLPCSRYRYSVSTETTTFRSRRSRCCVGTAAILILLLTIGVFLGLMLHFAVVDVFWKEIPVTPGTIPIPRGDTLLVDEVPDFLGSMKISNLDWEFELADTHSSRYKQLAFDAEQELDRVFLESPIRNIYNYSLVKTFRRGSIVVVFESVLTKRSSLTSQQLKEALMEGVDSRNYLKESKKDDGEKALLFDAASIQIVILSTTTWMTSSAKPSYTSVPFPVSTIINRVSISQTTHTTTTQNSTRTRAVSPNSTSTHITSQPTISPVSTSSHVLRNTSKTRVNSSTSAVTLINSNSLSITKLPSSSTENPRLLKNSSFEPTTTDLRWNLPDLFTTSKPIRDLTSKAFWANDFTTIQQRHPADHPTTFGDSSDTIYPKDPFTNKIFPKISKSYVQFTEPGIVTPQTHTSVFNVSRTSSWTQRYTLFSSDLSTTFSKETVMFQSTTVPTKFYPFSTQGDLGMKHGTKHKSFPIPGYPKDANKTRERTIFKNKVSTTSRFGISATEKYKSINVPTIVSSTPFTHSIYVTTEPLFLNTQALSLTVPSLNVSPSPKLYPKNITLTESGDASARPVGVQSRQNVTSKKDGDNLTSKNMFSSLDLKTSAVLSWIPYSHPPNLMTEISPTPTLQLASESVSPNSYMLVKIHTSENAALKGTVKISESFSIPQPLSPVNSNALPESERLYGDVTSVVSAAVVQSPVLSTYTSPVKVNVATAGSLVDKNRASSLKESPDTLLTQETDVRILPTKRMSDIKGSLPVLVKEYQSDSFSRRNKKVSNTVSVHHRNSDTSVTRIKLTDYKSSAVVTNPDDNQYASANIVPNSTNQSTPTVVNNYITELQPDAASYTDHLTLIPSLNNKDITMTSPSYVSSARDTRNSETLHLSYFFEDGPSRVVLAASEVNGLSSRTNSVPLTLDAEVAAAALPRLIPTYDKMTVSATFSAEAKFKQINTSYIPVMDKTLRTTEAVKRHTTPSLNPSSVLDSPFHSASGVVPFLVSVTEKDKISSTAENASSTIRPPSKSVYTTASPVDEVTTQVVLHSSTRRNSSSKTSPRLTHNSAITTHTTLDPSSSKTTPTLRNTITAFINHKTKQEANTASFVETTTYPTEAINERNKISRSKNVSQSPSPTPGPWVSVSSSNTRTNPSTWTGKSNDRSAGGTPPGTKESYNACLDINVMTEFIPNCLDYFRQIMQTSDVAERCQHFLAGVICVTDEFFTYSGQQCTDSEISTFVQQNADLFKTALPSFDPLKCVV